MDPLGELLTQKLCEVERTQSDLHDWVHAVIDASAVSADTRSRFQLRKDLLAKKFMEEIWPLSLVADHCYRGPQDVAFRSMWDSGPFDAQILDAHHARWRLSTWSSLKHTTTKRCTTGCCISHPMASYH